MRVYIPDMTEFFDWMDKSGLRYAVLRGFLDFDRAYPPQGGKEDVDLIVEDLALPLIGMRYHKTGKKKGVKCDVYNVSGTNHGGFLGHAYYPMALAEEIFETRRMWKDRFYVPSAKAHFLSLIYHIAYQKAEGSKLDLYEERETKYKPELDMLERELGVAVPHTLWDFHSYLKKENCTIPFNVLASYVQNDYAKHHVRVSQFYVLLCAEQKGEMNLFVIRRAALKTQTHRQLIQMMRLHYDVLAIKDIPPLTRVLERKKMRGGKWKRGGLPAIAVVVFDPSPQATSAEERKIHPYVLNSRQFVKRDWREWFTQATGMKASSNPVHSTDNEAEAIAHLPLFFSEHEQEDILLRLSLMRGKP